MYYLADFETSQNYKKLRKAYNTSEKARRYVQQEPIELSGKEASRIWELKGRPNRFTESGEGSIDSYVNLQNKIKKRLLEIEPKIKKQGLDSYKQILNSKEYQKQKQQRSPKQVEKNKREIKEVSQRLRKNKSSTERTIPQKVRTKKAKQLENTILGKKVRKKVINSIRSNQFQTVWKSYINSFTDQNILPSENTKKIESLIKKAPMKLKTKLGLGVLGTGILGAGLYGAKKLRDTRSDKGKKRGRYKK